MHKKPSGGWLLLLLPVFYFFISYLYLTGIKSFFISHIDPPYAYLMNGANLASGNIRVGITEHPGTPVEIFAGIVILIKHLFSGSLPLYQDVLLHPESYLFTIGIVLTILLSFITFISGSFIFNNTGNLGTALLFQCAPLFFKDTIWMTVSLSAESLITIFGILLMAELYVHALKGKASNGNVIFFGFLSALLITTKIYCLPIVILVLFLLSERRHFLIYLFSTGIFGMLLLFPLYNQLRNFAGGIKGMIFHSGFYGQGQQGVIDPSQYKNNLIDIFTTHYVFGLFYLVIVAALFYGWWGYVKLRSISSHTFFASIGLVIFYTVFILLVAKQYTLNYPEPLSGEVISLRKFYYFIPLFISLPLAAVIVYRIFSPGLKINKAIPYIVLVALVAFGAKEAYSTCYDFQFQKNVQEYKTNEVLEQHKNIPVVFVTDGDKDCVEMALDFGISYSGKSDSPMYFDFVRNLYPNTYLYTTWSHQLMFWDKETTIAEVLNKKKQALIYLCGIDSVFRDTIFKRLNVKPGPTCKKIFNSSNNYESVYLVKSQP